jgi:secreted trypsin-like serine protease
MAILAGVAASIVALCLAGPATALGSTPVEVGPGIYLTEASNADTTGAPSRDARRALRSEIEPHVVGGSPTTIGEWPWSAAITRNPAMFAGNTLQRQFCGGSLVAPTLVITAAHCVFDFTTNSFTSATRYAAVTGRTQLSSSEGQEIPFASYWFFTDSSGNPLYSPVTNDWDAVLVQLASPSSASPILLAGPDEAATWERGRDAYVTGWGSTSEGGGRSDVLQAALIAIYGDSTCASPQVYDGLFHASVMVCAGRLAGGVDTCQGDSGGPLVVPLLGGGFRLVGDTSIGLGCGEPFKGGIYGRLADDPMRSALQNAALATAGVSIVGSGGQPAPQTAPETDILSGPSKKTKHKRARFVFLSSKDGATFTCKLDKRKPVPCESPASFKAKKKKGKHKLRIAATIFGVTEPTPAKYGWKVSKHGGGGGGGGGNLPQPR